MSDPSNCLKFFMADNMVISATARTKGVLQKCLQIPISLHLKHI